MANINICEYDNNDHALIYPNTVGVNGFVVDCVCDEPAVNGCV
jgi:hypothetical protein